MGREYALYLKEKERRAKLKKQSAAKKKHKKKKGGDGGGSAEQKEEVLAPLEPMDEPTAIFSRFVEVAVEYMASESEMIGLDMIIESPPDGQELDSPAMLMNDTNHLEIVLQSLLQNIDDIEKYVRMVVDGKRQGDE